MSIDDGGNIISLKEKMLAVAAAKRDTPEGMAAEMHAEIETEQIAATRYSA